MPSKILENLLRFHEEDPDDAFTRFALATEYLKRNEVDRALYFFEGLVRDIPEYVGTYYHLGKLYEKLGRRQEALEIYRKGIEVAQAQREFHLRAELQSALLEAEGIGFEDEDFD